MVKHRLKPGMTNHSNSTLSSTAAYALEENRKKIPNIPHVLINARDRRWFPSWPLQWEFKAMKHTEDLTRTIWYSKHIFKPMMLFNPLLIYFHCNHEHFKPRFSLECLTPMALPLIFFKLKSFKFQQFQQSF